jgi:LuxR family maltose regulon positive regulatory protein
VPVLIERRDLVAALERAAGSRVAVVSAPAGSGKTSLLRLWQDRYGRGRRIAFLSVRPGQQDAQLFWHSLLGTVHDATGSARTEPPITPGFDGYTMVDKALSAIGPDGEPFYLVLDDLHELGSAEALDQLTSLLTRLPPHAHAVIATRGGSPPGLHRLRLSGDLAELRVAQLRFTAAETRELLATARIPLPAEVATTLHERTEGWAAGLGLAVLSLAGHPDPERFVAEFSGSDRTVAEYLMAEMLERQPDDVRRLLLRTSLTDRVSGGLADALTGTTGSDRILLELEEANAFVVALDAGRTWFRYHNLFAGLLRLELRRTHAAEIPALHRIAAGWFAEHALPADAVRHLQAAADWPGAARLLADHALSMTLDGQAGTVAALLHAFPAGAGAQPPELAVVHAIAALDRMHLEEAAAQLEIARSGAETTASRMVVTTVDLLLARLRGHFPAVYEQVEALPSPLTGHSNADLALLRDLHAVALLNLGVTEAWSLRLAESERHLSDGAARAREIGRPYLEVACLAHLGFATTVHSLAVARRRCEEAMAEAARHGWDSEPVIAPAQATLAGILVGTGEFDQGEHWLERAKRLTRAEGEPGIRLLVHLVAALLLAGRGRHHEALPEFAAARRVQADMAGEHALSARVTAWMIATQARCGLVEEAKAALDQAVGQELHTAAAVVRLAEGDPAGARKELRPALGAASVLVRTEASLVDALACRDLDDPQAAHAAVEHALNLAEPDRLILPFAMTGARELLESLRDTSHAAFVADILDAVRGVAPTNPLPAEELSPSELRVLRYLPTNLTRPEIAGQLSVSVNTVNTHIRRIYAKLGATDRTAAVRRGRELRLLAAGRT